MNVFDGASPQLADLQLILMVNSEGTITRAAHRLGTSQSALSYRLERMRKRFGDPLFVRVGHRMMPTPLAQRLMEPAARVMRILETEVAALARFDPASTTRQFRLGVNEIGAMTLVPQLIKALARHAPHAIVLPMRVDAERVNEQLENGELDLAAGHFPGMQGRLIQQLLYHREYTCVARQGHPTVGDSITWRQFQSTPQAWSQGVLQTMGWVDARLPKKATQPPRRMFTQHFAAIPFIVATSDFISLIPLEIYELYKPIAQIKSVRLPSNPPLIDVHQYWHPRMASDPALRFFRELIHGVAQSLR